MDDTVEQTNMREQFLEELGEPIIDGELPAVVIFQQVLSVAGDKSSTIPTKKILLLLWKIVLVMQTQIQQKVRQNKSESRRKIKMSDFA